ncbi:MAG: TRAP transporter large permease subunit [Candidatus Rokubacteria bacterium]|nr:TRAP transporter large permease subunit [Candidatus Rokubacteria bacterium]
MAVSPETLGLALLGSLFAGIFVGFPIAFTLIFLALAFGWIGFGLQVFPLMVFQFFGVMQEGVLAAVPLFIFMGVLLEQAGLMDRLFRAFQLMLAPVRGSLYLAVMFTATIFAAATGIVGASVTLLGLMASPSMKRSGYDVRLSAGVITAGGTLGILIPPSVMLVVMGPVVGVSVVDLFAAAIIPGLVLAGLFTTYAMVRSFLDPRLGPPLPRAERAGSVAKVIREFVVGLVPPAVLVLASLGSILSGLATPTEGAAMGAFGALLLTLAYRRLTWNRLVSAVLQTTEVSTLVLFLAAASNFFGAVFSRLGTPIMITETIVGLQLPPMAVLLTIMALIFVLAWPLEWVPIVLIVIPILLPVVRELGVNLVWFCTLVAVNLQTAWLSPPVALSAYFLKGVVPDWDLKDIYLGMMEFMVLQVLGLALVLAFPALALWLPSVLLE